MIGVGPVDVIGIKTQLGSGLPVHVLVDLAS